MHILAARGDKKNNVVLSVFGVDSMILCYKHIFHILEQILFNSVKINIFINLDKHQQLCMVHYSTGFLVGFSKLPLKDSLPNPTTSSLLFTTLLLVLTMDELCNNSNKKAAYQP